MSNDKHPGGRPTKYRSEYCDTVVEVMRDGGSKVEVCATIGVCYETFQNWQKEHKEFSESVKHGSLLSQTWWEKLGRKGASCEDEIQPTTWIFNMKNRFDWKDKVDTEMSGKDGKPLIINFSNSDAGVL